MMEGTPGLSAIDVDVPRQDDAIDQGLAQVESKLTAWAEAMREAQEALGRAAIPTPEPQAQAMTVHDTPEAPEPCLTVAAQEPPGEQVAGEPCAPLAQPPSPEAPMSEALAGEPHAPVGEPEESAPVAADTPLRGETAELQGEEQPPPQQDPPPAEEQPEEEDEEALLASVDEETARAVRIMRRLAQDGRSVRELIEECKVMPPSPSLSRPEKRSWWSRGK
jgi:hypothetical protein